MHPALRPCGRVRRVVDRRLPPSRRLSVKRGPAPRPARNARAPPSSEPRSPTTGRIRSRPTTTSAMQGSSQEMLADQAAAAVAATDTVDPIKELVRNPRNVLPLSLVQSPAVKLALPLLGNASYVALASGFLMTDMLALRVALVGGYAGLVAFHSLHARPLRIPLRWSALFVLVNAGAACFLVADQFPGSLTEEEERLHEEHFSMMTRGQFKQLMDLGTRRTLPAGSRLTVEGEGDDTLYFTRRGRSRLYLRGRYAKDIEEGSFVNDVAFHREGGGDGVGDGVGAYGTVVTDGEAEVIQWNWGELREHLRTRPEMDRNVRLCLTSQLVKGLLQQRKAAYANSELLLGLRDPPDAAAD